MSVTISDITVRTIQGVEKSLGDYAGNVLLVVNVASEWGRTPQYSGLEELHEMYFDRGFRVLGFPCNDFGGQEPGTNEEILEFARDRFGVTFDMFEKLHCIGPQQHPLYARLVSAFTPAEDVRWNFEKFLVDKNGAVFARYRSGVEPGSDEMLADIEKALG